MNQSGNSTREIRVYLSSSVVRSALKSILQPFPAFPFVIGVSQMIANHRIGRVLLHALCALHDRRWEWHWRGIAREFTEHFVQPGPAFPFVSSRGR